MHLISPSSKHIGAARPDINDKPGREKDYMTFIACYNLLYSGPVKGGMDMSIYVMLTKLTDNGANTINRDPGRIKEVNKDVEDLGARVLAQYALMGEDDFLNILEAPDTETIMRISLKLASRGSLRIKTIAALPVDDFISAMK
jgi:uncharacterized protein with GYD domain